VNVGHGLLIRADADDRIGTGHVMRCLAIAQAWQDAGREGPVWLASAALPDAVRRRYEREGASVLAVGPDPADLRALLHSTGPAWVVLDGYGLGVAHQRAVKDDGRRVLVVDDDGVAGAYIADVVVDANAFAEEPPYANRSSGTTLLLGPRYALLRRELRRSRPSPLAPAPEPVDARVAPVGPVAPARPVSSAEASEHRPRVLVTFGGADPAGLSPIALEAMASLDVKVRLIVGPANQRGDALARLSAGMPRVEMIRDPADLRALMSSADLALVAAGATCLELAHSGVPQIAVVTAENQRRVASALAARGVARSLGEAGEITAAVLREAVTTLLDDPAARGEMGRLGMELVDGQGAARLIEAMAFGR